MSVLRLRVFTALVLGSALILAILYLPAVATALILALIVLMGAWEWSAFLGTDSPTLRAAYVGLIAALGAFGWRYGLQTQAFALLMRISVGWWVLALIWIISAPQRVLPWSAAIAGILALVPTWLALERIDALWPHGAQWTLFILLLAFAADTGAFFAGRRVGRARLAPRVSPNKTWEGVLGGMTLALLVGMLCAAWFRMPLIEFLSLCLAAAAFSVVGDLTESLFKRHVGLKDSGRIFPGHGGVLDRIDSVTAATPVMALGLMWLGVGA